MQDVVADGLRRTSSREQPLGPAFDHGGIEKVAQRSRGVGDESGAGGEHLTRLGDGGWREGQDAPLQVIAVTIGLGAAQQRRTIGVDRSGDRTAVRGALDGVHERERPPSSSLVGAIRCETSDHAAWTAEAAAPLATVRSHVVSTIACAHPPIATEAPIMSYPSRSALLAAPRSLEITVLSSGPAGLVCDAAAAIHADDVRSDGASSLLAFAAAASVDVNVFDDPGTFREAEASLVDADHSIAAALLSRLHLVGTLCPLPTTRVVVLIGAVEHRTLAREGLAVAALAHAAVAIGCLAPATLVVFQGGPFQAVDDDCVPAHVSDVAHTLGLEDLGGGLHACWSSAPSFRRSIAVAMQNAHRLGE